VWKECQSTSPLVRFAEVSLSMICGKVRTETVDADPLVLRKVHHLAFQCEVVAFFCAAHDSLALGTHDFYPEVVE
jgi:hypothetical protein